MENTAEFSRFTEWTSTGRTASSAQGRWGVSSSRDRGGSSLKGNPRESGQSIDGGSGENWSKGWRFRGEGRPMGSSLLVPPRRS